jgi:hypothetical protein
MLLSPSRLLLVNALGDMSTAVINFAVNGGLPRQVEPTLIPMKQQRDMHHYDPVSRILAAELRTWSARGRYNSTEDYGHVLLLGAWPCWRCTDSTSKEQMCWSRHLGILRSWREAGMSC